MHLLRRDTLDGLRGAALRKFEWQAYAICLRALCCRVSQLQLVYFVAHLPLVFESVACAAIGLKSRLFDARVRVGRVVIRIDTVFLYLNLLRCCLFNLRLVFFHLYWNLQSNNV